MSKWIFKKQASELDEINKQIEELNKRKQQLENSSNNESNEDQKILNANKNKYFIVRDEEGYIYGDSGNDYDDNDIFASSVKNIYFFNTQQEAEDALAIIVNNLLYDENDEEYDPFIEEEYYSIILLTNPNMIKIEDDGTPIFYGV